MLGGMSAPVVPEQAARAAREDADRVRAELDAAGEEHRRERDALEGRLREVEQRRREAEKVAAAERKALRERLEEAVAAESRAGDLSRAQERAAALEAQIEEQRRSTAADREKLVWEILLAATEWPARAALLG